MWVLYLAQGYLDSALAPSPTTTTPSMFCLYWGSNPEPSVSQLRSQQTGQIFFAFEGGKKWIFDEIQFIQLYLYRMCSNQDCLYGFTETQRLTLQVILATVLN